MFEKEAEKNAERKISNFIPQQWGVSLIRTEPTCETVEGAPHFYLNSLAKMWQDGAEFGYNKAKEELNQKGLALQSDMDKTIEQNIALKKELNKANEWHYVKDGDYPKDNKPVLCILGDINSDNCEVGYYNDVESEEPWHFETYHLPDDDGDNAWGVIAWKEIVLPELKESE